VKDPRLGLCRLPETIGDQSLLGRLEELLNLLLCEFAPEPGRFFRGEVSFLPIPFCFGHQLDMAVIQRVEHLAEDIEELIITCLPCDFGSAGNVLLLPIDISQFEKWIPVTEGFPQLFEILFGVANDHGGDPLCSIEVALERSSSADVQRNAMEPTAQHF
jgi:hypothetical protein